MNRITDLHEFLKSEDATIIARKLSENLDKECAAYREAFKIKNMKTIIINGRRELSELPEKWYTKGTNEANEWSKSVYTGEFPMHDYKFVANSNKISNGCDICSPFEKEGHIYITESEFIRLVYKPWKDGLKPSLPISYEELIHATLLSVSPMPHIKACIELTNIMHFANDAFKSDGDIWEVDNSGHIDKCNFFRVQPILFTSKLAAAWAYKTFAETFKAYWNA